MGGKKRERGYLWLWRGHGAGEGMGGKGIKEIQYVNQSVTWEESMVGNGEPKTAGGCLKQSTHPNEMK